ncbi:membrane or secreted protein [Candidatus Omnitrophus magneticus]|uniref:Membrane or secreted protein n=1 Tax=Candidatus Omnitrophus magneticus TaxID=1609969 RepID=A0A0F0CP09_9BACT|nr:membrane or secreted protein [Candidatus Omnitrophus magneticus]
MRRIFLFILPILIVIAAAFTIFGYFQVRFEEGKLFDDMKRKSKHIAESMELSARVVFVAKDMRNANYLVEKFETRERLQGCVLYDKDGNIIAITKRFNDWKEKDKPYVKDLLSNKTDRGELEKFKGYTVYSYALPVTDYEGQVLGLIEVIHDTSYVLTRLTEISSKSMKNP